MTSSTESVHHSRTCSTKHYLYGIFKVYMKLNYINDCSKLPGIYKIINTHTNRIYVGQCSSFKQRWYSHSQALKANRHQNKFLQNDFNKCVVSLNHDDFLEFHVLEIIGNSTKQERNLREEYWIAQHYDHGKQCYNLTKKAFSRKGSPSKAPTTTKQRLSFALKGRVVSKEAREKLSYFAKERWKNPEYKEKMIAVRLRCAEQHSKRMSGTLNPMFGRPMPENHKRKLTALATGRVMSAETKQKCAAASRGRIKSVTTRAKLSKSNAKFPVQQFTKDNVFVAEYYCAAEASRKTNISKSNIALCIKALRPTAGGFIWRRA